jgi:hypothetical protein
MPAGIARVELDAMNPMATRRSLREELMTDASLSRSGIPPKPACRIPAVGRGIIQKVRRAFGRKSQHVRELRSRRCRTGGVSLRMLGIK